MYDITMAQFVLKIAKLSHIMGARGSQGLRSVSPIMAPDCTFLVAVLNLKQPNSIFEKRQEITVRRQVNSIPPPPPTSR